MEVTPETDKRKRRRCADDAVAKTHVYNVDDEMWENPTKTSDGLEPCIGLVLKREFDEKLYVGVVVSGPTQVKRGGEEVWHISYEDGDEEDLNTEELMKYACPVQEPIIGLTISKLFDDGKYYSGEVKKGPEEVKNKETGDTNLEWQILYEDGEKEDLSKEEILKWAIDTRKRPAQSKRGRGRPPKAKPGVVEDEVTPPKKRPGRKRKAIQDEEESEDENMDTEEQPGPPRKQPDNYCRPRDNRRMELKEIKRDLMYFTMGANEELIDAALAKMEPPYGMNEAMNLIHEAIAGPVEDHAEEAAEKGDKKFMPEIGLKIRKNFQGCTYYGEVTNEGEKKVDDDTGKEVRMWQVTFTDGDVEDMDFLALLEHRASRPIRPHPVRGRMLCALELFSGEGIVTQAFADRRWRVKSIDNSYKSYATNMVDIMDLDFDKHLGMVPDFIWASPPCTTYSLMAGGTHRNPKEGKYEMSELARQHNRLLTRLYYIIQWAKKKKPHLIVVIENPRALLKAMPLMQEMERSLNLFRVTVDYCAFGRPDQKPTDLWTNDLQLRNNLSYFSCRDRCVYNGYHAVGARANGHQYNAAAIPDFLAEEVAEYVSARFCLDYIRYKTEPGITEEEKTDFRMAMVETEEEAQAIAAAAANNAEDPTTGGSATGTTEDLTESSDDQASGTVGATSAEAAAAASELDGKPKGSENVDTVAMAADDSAKESEKMGSDEEAKAATEPEVEVAEDGDSEETSLATQEVVTQA
ncbi:expressed unknown protein [Seminavis robusta]|uniref:DNA (cytosine-5-)-methyltransferase n=1 Tax=Seminavis robusta TaxID=568900 RepID=A0A9N8DSK7_9STRA|nr:expressed unknown protein [Seminavis robusta]|eukprot:Sro312_g114570.1 n/a (749) ;mRNA; r:28528-31020